MIHNQDELQSARDAVASLERSLAILQKDKERIHPDRYALMAAPILEDLRRIRQEIDDYVGVTAAVRATVPLWLGLRGPGMELDYAPSSVVTAMVDILRLGVQAVAEFLTKGALGGRPTALLKQACELRLVAWQPGSVQVGLVLPEVSPALLPEVDLAGQAREALRIYLAGAAWVGSELGEDELKALLPDPEQRRLVLNQVARLIPRPRGGLESVDLSGRAVPHQHVRLRRESRQRVRSAISQTLRAEVVRKEGVLREIDLDERTFTLRHPETGEEFRCRIGPQADDLLDIAKAGLDHPVAVAGTRRPDPTRRQTHPLDVDEIEILDLEEGIATEQASSPPVMQL